MDPLNSSQKYLTKWLVRYDDEYFGYLYYDIENLASTISNEVFQQNRSYSLYGVKGIGKTTLMQGILWEGLKNSGGKSLPVNVSVTGASGVTNQSELEKIFYKSVLEGLLQASEIADRYGSIKEIIKDYAPWVSAATLAALSLVFPPATIAAAAATEVIKQLLEKVGFEKKEQLVITTEVDPQYAVNFIIEELRNKNIHPVFAIDELDKVLNGELLSEFFDGNQGWFQGKRTIISLSYTYGNSIKDATITSVGRFSTIQKLDGIQTLEQFNTILKPRLLLGISEVERYEQDAKTFAENIFSKEIPEQIVNRFIPNLHLMLEESFNAIKNAKIKGLAQVTINELTPSGEELVKKPTELEKLILDELTNGKIQSSVLADKLNRNRSVMSRSLAVLYAVDYVGKIEEGRNAHYFIKQKGESARHINSD